MYVDLTIPLDFFLFFNRDSMPRVKDRHFATAEGPRLQGAQAY